MLMNEITFAVRLESEVNHYLYLYKNKQTSFAGNVVGAILTKL